MKNNFLIRWSIWTLVGILLIFGVSFSDKNNSILYIIALALSTAPLLGTILALGSLKGAEQFKAWEKNTKYSIYYIAGAITFLFALPGILMWNFNPYFTTIFGFIVLVVFGLLKQSNADEFKLEWSDIAIWIILWIPFDLRWYMDMLPAVESISYTWWALAISTIAIIGWYVYRGADIGFNLVPKWKDFYIASIALIMIMIVLVPPGILTGFLAFSTPESYDIPNLTIHFVGLFLTVALPEELFFRGILLRGLEKKFTNKWIPLIISSLAFGLMHWNNVGTLNTQIMYIILAAIAGMGYGWAYRKSGNNLFAAIFTHTMVDWIWKLYLSNF